jgi:protein TonB
MLSQKFDLYRSEWLELVFDDRNKAYGAYDLRKNYDNTLLKALGFTVLPVVFLFLLSSFIMTRKAIPAPVPMVPVDLNVHPPVVTHPPVTPPKPRVEPPVQQRTVAFPPPVVADDNVAKNPPTIEAIDKSTIGQTNKDGIDGGNIDIPPTPAGSGVTEDNSVHTINSIEVMPTFPGGEAAWAKFLQKNLHYPGQALDANISGKVYISFVVEKDGHLSNITVDRTPGYGLDAEAVRVLKLVPPWKPGMQNGQAVRVRYSMPFNFQIPSSD